ncbi:MAG: ABC transporter substrate-binding protein [Bdellovibrionia bacterium]
MGGWRGLGLGCLWLLTACQSGGSKPEGISTYRTASAHDVQSWDPLLATDPFTRQILSATHESLYQSAYLEDDHRIEPLLAAGMPQYSSDALTVTIPIQKGIYFQPDPCWKKKSNSPRELVAQDFVTSFKRLALPWVNSPSRTLWSQRLMGFEAFQAHLASGGNVEWAKRLAEGLSGVSAVGSHVLQIRLLREDPQLLHALTQPWLAPLPSELLQCATDAQGRVLRPWSGTGAFRVSQWVRNQKIRLDRNPQFRKERYPTRGASQFFTLGLMEDAGKSIPFLDRLEFQIEPDSSLRWLSFLKGELEELAVPAQELSQVLIQKSNLSPPFVQKGLHLELQGAPVMQVLAMNMRDPVLGSHPGVRKAISASVNRELWIKKFTSGVAKKMKSILPEGMGLQQVQPGRLRWDYNPELARQWLKKEGFPNGKGLPVFQLDLESMDPWDRKLGEFLVGQFKAVGIQCQLNLNSSETQRQKAERGELQLSLLRVSPESAEGLNLLERLSSPLDATHYQNPSFDAWLEQVAFSKSKAERLSLILKMDALIQDEVPWVYGVQQSPVVLAQPWLFNAHGSSWTLSPYKYLKVQREIQVRYENERSD